MAWFFSSSSSSPPSSSSSSTATSSINSSGANNSNNNNNNTNSNNGGGGCPVDHGKISSKSTSASGCPIDHSSSSSTINPLNMMPNMKNERVAGQTLDLPLERTQSTIPKGSAKGTSRTDESKGSGVWEYPSPQVNQCIQRSW